LLGAGLLLPALGAVLLAVRAVSASSFGTAGDPGLGLALFGPYAAAAEAVALLMFFAALAVIESPEEKR
jgi:hypothetical protein